MEECVEPLTYTYNTQFRMSTKTTAFNLVLPRQPLSIAAVVPRTNLPFGSYRGKQPCTLQLFLLDRKRAPKEDFGGSTSTIQGSAKRNFDKIVQVLSKFEAGQSLPENTPRRAVLVTEADRAIPDSIDKLIPQVSAPFEIVAVRYNGLMIIIEDIEHTISIDRAHQASVLHKNHQANFDEKVIPENRSLPQDNKTVQENSKEYVR